jgi:hypothetical protein
MVLRSGLVAVVAVAALAGACSSGKTKGVGASSPSSSSSSATSPAGSCSSTSTTNASGKGDAAPPGDIPDNQAYVAFSPASGGYSIKVPEGWARSDDGGAAMFTDKFNSVRVEVVSAAQAPTADSVTATDVPVLQRQTSCFQLGKVSAVTRTAGQAILITYQTDSTPNSVTGKTVREDVERYLFWRNGTEAVITLSGSHGSDNVDPWKLVTDSFTWK